MPSSRALHLIDAAVATWVAAWIGIGVAIGVNVGDLTTLSGTVVTEGHAVEAVGRSLGPLEAAPLVGGSVGEDSRQIQRAGASAVRSGGESVSTVDTLAVLLAVAVALVPSVPVLALYLPVRLGRGRRLRALLGVVSRSGS